MFKKSITLSLLAVTALVHSENYVGKNHRHLRCYPIYDYPTPYAESECKSIKAQVELDALRKEFSGNSSWHRLAKNMENDLDGFWNAKMFNVEHVFPKAAGIIIPSAIFATWLLYKYLKSPTIVKKEQKQVSIKTNNAVVIHVQ